MDYCCELGFELDGVVIWSSWGWACKRRRVAEGGERELCSVTGGGQSYQIAVLDTEIPQADHTRSSTQLQLSHYNEWE